MDDDTAAAPEMDDGDTTATVAAVEAPPKPRKIGAPSRPSVLLYGVAEQFPAGVVEAVEDLAPNWTIRADLDGLRQAEWDVVIWAGCPQNVTLGIDAPLAEVRIGALIVAFVDLSRAGMVDGGYFPRQDYSQVGRRIASGEQPFTTEDMVEFDVRVRDGHHCNVFIEPDGDDPELSRLVLDSLIPAARARDVYASFEVEGVDWAPLALDDDGKAMAVRYERRDYTFGSPTWGDVIMVPHDVARPDRWIRWAFDVWRRRQRDRFTELRTWTNDPRWQTADDSRSVV